VLLRAGVNRVVADGRTIHVPRMLINPDADWVGELEELPTDAGNADTLELVPRKIGNVVSLSRESVETRRSTALRTAPRSWPTRATSCWP
jgi:hypothetical protein